MKPSLAAVSFLWGALLCAGACADRSSANATPGEGPPVAGGTAVIASPSDLDHANSLVSSDRYAQEVLRYALFLPLVQHDARLAYSPALAASWQLIGDSALVMTLRRDVRWHDGEPTTAFDVSFTFERARDPRTAYPNRDYFAYWSDAEVIDSFTVRFRMTPHADPLAPLPFFPIMPRHLLDSIPPERMAQAAFNHRPIGNGAFRFVEYRPNDRWVFEANDDFPRDLGGRPYLDRVVWRVIPDGGAQAIEAQTGGADLLLAPPADAIALLDSAPTLHTVVRPGRQYGFIGWNGRRPPLGDAAVRRALTMAIDRGRIIDALRDGQGEIAAGPIFPGHWAYDPGLEPLPFAPDSARALLEQAGLRDVDGDGVREFRGAPFEIRLDYPAGSSFNRDFSELLEAQLRAVGVRLVPRALDYNTLIANLTGAARNFDAVLTGWESDFRLNLRDLFHTAALGGPLQFASYSNAEVDRILDETDRITDREHAKPLLHRLQQIMRDEQPWTFLYYFPDVYVANDRLRGVEMDERGALVSLARWWIPEAARNPGAAQRSGSADPRPSPDSARPR